MPRKATKPDNARSAVTHTKEGKLAPGNPWRFPKGTSGHKARYETGKAIANQCERYLQSIPEDQVPTWSGLAVSMGMSSNALDRYRKGETPKDSKENDAIVAVLEYMGTIIESRIEAKLVDRDSFTPGQKFALTNRFKDRWRSEQHISVDKAETQTLQLIIPKALAEKRGLIDRGIVIEEGEVIEEGD